MTPESKYKASIILSAVGDSLGWMTEFKRSPNAVEKSFGTRRVTDFHRWEKTVGGRFWGYRDIIQPGSYSDDTQLLLAVARCIRRDGTVNQKRFANVELPCWLGYARGAGRTVKTAARKISRKSATWNNNFFSLKTRDGRSDYRDAGANGAAMRILPIALANFTDYEAAREQIFANSIITHGHPRALIGALLFGYAVDRILGHRPESFDPLNYLEGIGKELKTALSLPFLGSKPYQKWVDKWNRHGNEFPASYEEVVEEVLEGLREVYRSVDRRRATTDTLSALGCFAPETKGSGTATVLAGIFLCCRYAELPRDAVLEAVNAVGSDTDSIAAFAGGLCGALHGVSIIPKKWRAVQDYGYLETVALNLLEISEKRAGDSSRLVLPAEGSRSIELLSLSQDVLAPDKRVFLASLGTGTVRHVDRQPTRNGKKYNVVAGIDFDVGQYCVFSTRFDGKLEDSRQEDVAEDVSENGTSDRISRLRQLADRCLPKEERQALDDALDENAPPVSDKALTVIELLLNRLPNEDSADSSDHDR